MAHIILANDLGSGDRSQSYGHSLSHIDTNHLDRHVYPRYTAHTLFLWLSRNRSLFLGSPSFSPCGGVSSFPIVFFSHWLLRLVASSRVFPFPLPSLFSFFSPTIFTILSQRSATRCHHGGAAGVPVILREGGRRLLQLTGAARGRTELQWEDDPGGGRRCCNRSSLMLRLVVVGAATGHRWCYDRSPPVYEWWPSMLRSVTAGATTGHRQCYEWWPSLQWPMSTKATTDQGQSCV